VERYKKHLAGGKKLSPVSVSTYLTALRRFCAYLVRVRVIAENPALAVGGNSRPTSHSRGTLTAADVDSLLNSVDRTGERGLRDYAFLKLMIGCALSEIEIVRADVGDLAEEQGTFCLKVQGKGRVKKDQRVALPADVHLAVAEYLLVRASPRAGEPLFTSAGNRTRGRRMTTRGVRDRVNLSLDHSGLKESHGKRLTPYSLRHTAAALMARAGASAEEIRDHLRLGSVATAMLYVHAQPKQAGTP
jgi:site-specific recombinase XerD